MFINKSSSGKNNICGETIAYLRKMHELSQRELADALQVTGLDIDKNAIQRIEAGKRFVTDIEVLAFSSFFDMTPNELLIPAPEKSQIP